MASRLLTRDLASIVYPSEDGQPMAESDFQRTPLMYAVEALRRHFRDRSDVYVSGNLFIYYREGSPRSQVAPDVFVVFGAPNHDRCSYLLWQEPKAPDWVLEITSHSTRQKDQYRNPRLYAALGVGEYWQYDPTQDYLVPALQGSQLLGKRYVRLAERWSPDGTLVVASPVLGLELHLTAEGLRFVDPQTGQRLRNYDETEHERQAAEQAHQAAEQARQAAEQARQAAELARQREQQAHQETAAALQAALARLSAMEARASEQS